MPVAALCHLTIRPPGPCTERKAPRPAFLRGGRSRRSRAGQASQALSHCLIWYNLSPVTRLAALQQASPEPSKATAAARRAGNSLEPPWRYRKSASVSHLLKALLAELSDGLAHPCDRLARRLSISTTQVDSAIHTLREWGLECEREAGGLCRLSIVPDLFDRATIERALPQALRQDLGLVLLLSTDSTNDHIWQQKDRSETWQLCLAEHQSRGRGRRGASLAQSFCRCPVLFPPLAPPEATDQP